MTSAYMIRSYFTTLYGSTSAEFESAFDMEESVRRLRDAAHRPFFQRIGEPQIAGSVKEQRVVLQWAEPIQVNTFKPLFYGHFTHRHGRVVLLGKFRISTAARIIYTIILTFFLLLSSLVMLADFISKQQAHISPTTIALLIGFFILPIFARDAADGHVMQISSSVRRALSGESA